ncbi:MAG: hypothetical protein OXI45_05725 [Acidobacteriota bacterium]|nr:hypothetical protein [Acidobacteriota bacterium]MDE2712110.1 hypothetical protein [Acidobacteriota bacterium]
MFVLHCSMTMARILPDESTPGTVRLRDSLVERTAAARRTGVEVLL